MRDHHGLMMGAVMLPRLQSVRASVQPLLLPVISVTGGVRQRPTWRLMWRVGCQAGVTWRGSFSGPHMLLGWCLPGV
jgi:hypothetical protein